MIKIAKHKETGTLYVLITDRTIDCTNFENDKRMVTYYRDQQFFTREYQEFLNKFELFDSGQIGDSISTLFNVLGNTMQEASKSILKLATALESET